MTIAVVGSLASCVSSVWRTFNPGEQSFVRSSHRWRIAVIDGSCEALETTMYTVVPNVMGYLEKDDGVLLGLREDRPSKIYRNHWDLPGGRIEPSETVAEALRREFLEETGLVIVNAHLMDAYHSSAPDEGAPGLCLLYRIEQAQGEFQASSDLQALEYVEKSRIRSLRLPPWGRYFLREYLDEGIGVSPSFPGGVA